MRFFAEIVLVQLRRHVEVGTANQTPGDDSTGLGLVKEILNQISALGSEGPGHIVPLAAELAVEKVASDRFYRRDVLPVELTAKADRGDDGPSRFFYRAQHCSEDAGDDDGNVLRRLCEPGLDLKLLDDRIQGSEVCAVLRS